MYDPPLNVLAFLHTDLYKGKNNNIDDDKKRLTRMPHSVTICLYPYLEKARLLLNADRLNSQTWRIGMSSND